MAIRTTVDDSCRYDEHGFRLPPWINPNVGFSKAEYMQMMGEKMGEKMRQRYVEECERKEMADRVAKEAEAQKLEEAMGPVTKAAKEAGLLGSSGIGQRRVQLPSGGYADQVVGGSTYYPGVGTPGMLPPQVEWKDPYQWEPVKTFTAVPQQEESPALHTAVLMQMMMEQMKRQTQITEKLTEVVASLTKEVNALRMANSPGQKYAAQYNRPEENPF